MRRRLLAIPLLAVTGMTTVPGAGATQPDGGDQTVVASAASVVAGGQEVTVRARVRPASPGRLVRLQRRVEDRWRTIDSAAQDSDRVELSFRPPETGPVRLRVTAARADDLGYRTSDVIPVRVAPPVEYALPRPAGSWARSDRADLYTTDVSADGRWITGRTADPRYARPGEYAEDQRIVLHDRLSRRTVRISPESGHDPSISGDGSVVVYADRPRLPPDVNRRPSLEIMLWDADEGVARQVSREVYEVFDPQVSDDGQHVVWWSGDPFFALVRTLDLRTGERHKLRGPGGRWDLRAPRVSRDGSTVFVRATREWDGVSQPNAPRRRAFFLWGADTGYERIDLGTPRDVGGIDLAADGRHLAYQLRSESGGFELRLRDLSTGDDRLVVAAGFGNDNPRLSGDGRFVAFEAFGLASGDGPCPTNDSVRCVVRWNIATGESDVLTSRDRSDSEHAAVDRTGSVVVYGLERAEVPSDAGLEGDTVVHQFP